MTALSEFLSPSELHDLTGYARFSQQSRWLMEKGIPHRLDGHRAIVSRTHVLAWLEGRTAVTSKGLNLAAIK